MSIAAWLASDPPHLLPRTGASTGVRSNDLAFKRVASLLVLDLDDPEIGIALELALDVGAGVLLAQESPLLGRQPCDATVHVARLAQHLESAIEQVELHDHGATPQVALAQDSRESAFGIAPAQVGLHPQFGGKAAVGRQVRVCAASAPARIWDKVCRGVITSGLRRISIKAGLPAFAARSKAGAKSAVLSTSSPCAP